jgi:hypothetical protein
MSESCRNQSPLVPPLINVRPNAAVSCACTNPVGEYYLLMLKYSTVIKTKKKLEVNKYVAINSLFSRCFRNILLDTHRRTRITLVEQTQADAFKKQSCSIR